MLAKGQNFSLDSEGSIQIPTNTLVQSNFSFASIVILLFTIFCLAVSYVSANLFVIIFIGLLPAVVAILIDTQKERCLSKIVSLFNFVGILPYLMQILLESEVADEIAFKLIMIPHVWFTIYLFAGFGWFLYTAVPKITFHFVNSRFQSKIDKMIEELEFINEKWGEENVQKGLGLFPDKSGTSLEIEEL